MNTPASASQDKDVSGESWKTAKAAAEKLGYVPASFSIAIRTLLQDQFNFDATLRPVTKYQTARLLQTPTFKAMIYYATQDLREGWIAEQDRITVGGMMDLFEPFDIAALIASFVYYRKAKGLLGELRWDMVQSQLSKDSQLGAQIGVGIPAVGIASGLISGTMLKVGTAGLILADESKFEKYRSHLERKNLAYDLDMEGELWGCTSQQVGVFCLSKLGFGVDIGEAFSVAMDTSRNVNSIKDPLQLKMKLGRLWIDTLKAGEDQPMYSVPGEFYPLQDQKERLNKVVPEIMGGKKNFLEMTKEDISEEKTPALFKKLEVSEDVPEELAAVFSVEEITAMEEEDFDDLVDKMDEEEDGDSQDFEKLVS